MGFKSWQNLDRKVIRGRLPGGGNGVNKGWEVGMERCKWGVGRCWVGMEGGGQKMPKGGEIWLARVSGA